MKLQKAPTTFAESLSRDYRFDSGVVSDDIKLRRRKDFFPFCGTQVFCGRQGSGKTMSMVKVLLDMKKKYPDCIVVTNLHLNVPWDYVEFSSMEELADLLVRCNNGQKGVVYAIDEIHTFFNALDSKSIPMYVFQEISQQRKQRKVIMGTSQLFLRMAKPFREQCDTLIICKCIGGKFNLMYAYDGSTLDEDFGKVTGTLIRTGFFMQTRQLREAYDTYQKVSVVAPIDMYDRGSSIVINNTIKGKGKLKK